MGENSQAFRLFCRLLVPTILLCVCCKPLLSNNRQTFATDLEGKPVDPLGGAKRKIVVLIFVRTDCPISNRYAPTIRQLSARHRNDATFFLVYPDKKETPDAIRKHDREFGYTFSALRDPQHVLVKHTQAQITPEAAVFDALGRLVYHGRIDNLYEDFGHARKSPTT